MAFISGIDPATPAGSDPANTADDQIRTLKADIKNSFPNIAAAVTVDQDTLNTAKQTVAFDPATATLSLSDSNSVDLSYLDNNSAITVPDEAKALQDNLGGTVYVRYVVHQTPPSWSPGANGRSFLEVYNKRPVGDTMVFAVDLSNGDLLIRGQIRELRALPVA